MTPDFKAFRAQFPLLSHTTYLNSGSYCALADGVKAAFEAYLEDRLLVGANWDVWMTKTEAVRAAMARLLGATSDEIAVTASASAGLNALASAFDFARPRDTVLVTDFEFPTSAQVWHAQAPRGARVIHVPRDAEGYISLEQFERLIDERTQLVAMTHVCFRNGARLDVEAVAKLAHARGARILLDCYQSVGTQPIDVKALDLDFAVGGMMKYLLGTAGVGFLYVRDRLIEGLVPTQSGWFAQEDIMAMDITANRPSPTARRFEAGTPPVANCYAAEAGLALINALGAEAIGARVRDLTRLCLDRLDEIGWSAITPSDDRRRGPMIAVPAREVGALVGRLGERAIVASHRDDNLRLGFHAYNDEGDVETVIAALAGLRAQHHPLDEAPRREAVRAHG